MLLRMKKAVKSQSIKAFHARMLSYFSHVRLSLCDPVDCGPPDSSVHGFSRQEDWSGLPLPSPGDLPDPGIKTLDI